MSIAIITGASSGLGAEFVGALCERFKKLDQIWLVARREDKLAEVSARFPGVSFRLFPLDLTDPGAGGTLAAALAEGQPKLRVLVNNAGYGKLGDFADADPEGQCGMVALNCEALVRVTRLCLPYMKEGCAVLNVASIAAFAPNPRMSVYCSTKAFVLSFSKSLRYELKKKKINVTAVCPGPMGTGFLDVAGITCANSRAFRLLPYCDPAKVARRSLCKALAGRAVYTPRFFFKFYRVLAKLLPHNWIMPMSKT